MSAEWLDDDAVKRAQVAFDADAMGFEGDGYEPMRAALKAAGLAEALDAIRRVRARIETLRLYDLKTSDYTIDPVSELLAALEG